MGTYIDKSSFIMIMPDPLEGNTKITLCLRSIERHGCDKTLMVEWCIGIGTLVSHIYVQGPIPGSSS